MYKCHLLSKEIWMNFNIYTRFSQKFAILTRFIVFERNHSLKLLAKERNSGHWRNGADL